MTDKMIFKFDVTDGRNVVEHAITIGAIFSAAQVELFRSPGKRDDDPTGYQIQISLRDGLQLLVPLSIDEQETLIERVARIFKDIYDASKLGTLPPVTPPERSDSTSLSDEDLTWVTQTIAAQVGANQSQVTQKTNLAYHVDFLFPDGEIASIDIDNVETSATVAAIDRYVSLCKAAKRGRKNVEAIAPAP